MMNNASSDFGNDNLTFEKLARMFDDLMPPLYYVLGDDCIPGQVIQVQKTRFFPEFILVHPDDLRKLQDLPGRRLMKLEDQPQKEQIAQYLEWAKNEGQKRNRS